MTGTAPRFPAEWERQSAILIAWPHAETDWAERLGEVEETYIALVVAITRFQPVLVCVANDDVEAYARARLASARVDMERVRFIGIDYDDTWLRDSGPITLRDGDGFRLLDFRFTGWGGKFEATRDDELVEGLVERDTFRADRHDSIDFALEGGAIETDGAGTLLTTWKCLHERHPQASRGELNRRLSGWLHQDRVLWLDHGYLEGDDTDAHIDTLARFAAPDAIVYQGCDDPADCGGGYTCDLDKGICVVDPANPECSDTIDLPAAQHLSSKASRGYALFDPASRDDAGNNAVPSTFVIDDVARAELRQPEVLAVVGPESARG